MALTPTDRAWIKSELQVHHNRFEEVLKPDIADLKKEDCLIHKRVNFLYRIYWVGVGVVVIIAFFLRLLSIQVPIKLTKDQETKANSINMPANKK